MQVLAAIVLLVILSLVGFRVYTHLAVHERRVVAAWDRLDTLITQRNGLLEQACAASRDDPHEDLRGLHQAVQEQERARRCGELSVLAQGERAVRAQWDRVCSQPIDKSTNYELASDRIPRRVAALDHAITEALRRYNAAVDACSALHRHWAYGVLARLAGYTAFEPVRPPKS